MKKIITYCTTLLILALPVRAADPAIVFVNNLTDKIIEDVLTADTTQDAKYETFRNEFTQALDLRSIGQFVLGVYWRRADEADRNAFLDAFMEFTTKTWAARFDTYQGQEIIFSGSRNAENNQLYVDSQIQNNPPVEVIWRLRQKDGDYKIIDIRVEGVSMAMSYRNEYASFLQSHGGDVNALTQELKKRSETFQFGQSE